MAARQVDALSEAAWKAIRAISALVKLATESVSDNDADELTQFRFFRSDLELHLATISEKFPYRAPTLTEAARSRGPVPLSMGGFCATSAHALALNIAMEVLENLRRVRPKHLTSWAKCKEYLRTLAIDGEWIIAAIIAESDFDQVNADCNALAANTAGASNKSRRSKGGRKPADDATQRARKLVVERWECFSAEYRKLGYTRKSFDNFALWACDNFDDMPSDDPIVLEKMKDAHLTAKRRTPKTARSSKGSHLSFVARKKIAKSRSRSND